MKNKLIQVNENEFKVLFKNNAEKHVLLCATSLQKIHEFEQEFGVNLGFHLTKYASCTFKKKSLFMHQIITRCYGNGRGKGLSVDHIDRDRNNNKFDNLRIATMEEQMRNSRGYIEGTRRRRKRNCAPLPEGVEESMLNKNVFFAKRGDKEYFTVRHIPVTSLSPLVPILEKLRDANAAEVIYREEGLQALKRTRLRLQLASKNEKLQSFSRGLETHQQICRHRGLIAKIQQLESQLHEEFESNRCIQEAQEKRKLVLEENLKKSMIRRRLAKRLLALQTQWSHCESMEFRGLVISQHWKKKEKILDEIRRLRTEWKNLSKQKKAL